MKYLLLLCLFAPPPQDELELHKGKPSGERIIITQMTLEEMKKFWGERAGDIFATERNFEETGSGAVIYRFIEPDIIYYKDHPEVWTKMNEYGLSWLAGYGVTTDGTMLYAPAQIRGYRTLEKEGRMPIRLPFPMSVRPNRVNGFALR